MRAIKSTVCATLAVILSTKAHALTESEAKTIYRNDKQKVLAGDLSFDWGQFRLAAKQGGTEYFDWHPLRNSFMQKMKNGDAVGALKDADVIIGHNMAEPEGHLLAFMAYRELNKADDAAYQHKSVEAWVKSPATAFIVVGEGEEYFYLNAIMGYRFPSSQSLVQRDGHSYDLMKIKDRAGADQEVWFNVDVSMAASKDALGNAKK